jgi:hypothetical protein
MVGACKLVGRLPPTSEIRESDRRGEFTSPCTDGGRTLKLEVDRDRDGPIGDRTVQYKQHRVSAKNKKIPMGLIR